jgi:hypothetical protein
MRKRGPRRPIDLVEEMLATGTHWSGILAVARFARNGTWREEIKTILIDKKLMPSDFKKMIKERDIELTKQKARCEELRRQQRTNNCWHK